MLWLNLGTLVGVGWSCHQWLEGEQRGSQPHSLADGVSPICLPFNTVSPPALSVALPVIPSLGEFLCGWICVRRSPGLTEGGGGKCSLGAVSMQNDSNNP